MSQPVLSAYQCINHHPGGDYPLDAVGSVLHSVCAARSCTWKEAFAALLKASGALGMMPQYKQTIRKMLEDQGFYLQAGSGKRRSIESILAECSERFHDGEAVILKTSGSAWHSCYVPLVPAGADGGYVLQYPEDLREQTAAEIWIAWKDGQDHSIRPRRKSAKKQAPQGNQPADHPVQAHEALVVCNENPGNNLIGDCAVRAVAGVLEISWEKAVCMLAEALNYTDTVVNSNESIEALLKKEGFQEFEAIRRNGKMLTGKEFCDHIHDMFQAGTRIFAYVGNDHAAAILVFDDDYKIVDTWDSTDRYITKYWAKYPERPQRRPRNEEQQSQLTELSVGTRLRHKVFGAGEITALDNSFAEIRFKDGTEKRFAVSWILANCKPI